MVSRARVVNFWQLHRSVIVVIYLHTDTMPLITSATPSTFVQAEESVQPQALSHDESGIPVSSPSVIRNEASEAGVNHSSSLHSRSDELTERNMSPVEDMVLHLRSWYNYCCYSDVSEVQKCVQNYCGRVWTEVSNLVGLRLGSNTTTSSNEQRL